MNRFTPTQAAFLTGLPLKTIQKAIEQKAVPCRILRHQGNSARYLSGPALICLRLEAEGVNQLPLQLRRRIFRNVLQSPRRANLRIGDVICVEIDRARKGLAKNLKELRRAERMVVSNPAVMTGSPVIRGTRIPVHMIAEMREQSVSPKVILEGYPSISADQIALAEIYAQAHPKRGRPPVQPWAGKVPARRVRKRLPGAAA